MRGVFALRSCLIFVNFSGSPLQKLYLRLVFLYHYFTCLTLPHPASPCLTLPHPASLRITSISPVISFRSPSCMSPMWATRKVFPFSFP